MAVEEKRNINEDFGNRLREIIEKRKKETGQNLRAVAKDLDVSLGVLSDWQKRKIDPTRGFYCEACQVFWCISGLPAGFDGSPNGRHRFKGGC